MRYEVHLQINNTFIVDANGEEEAEEQVRSFGVWEVLDNADFSVTRVIPDPFNEESDV